MSKTLILSDIHFCRNHASVRCARKFRPLWKGCTALVLNGDTVEAHDSRTASLSSKETESLLSMAEQDGLQATLICGNHDPAISDTDYLWFCNERVLVFHGHAGFPQIAPWSWRAKYVEQARRRYIRDSGDGFEEQLLAVKKASLDAVNGKFREFRPTPLHMISLAIPASIKVFSSWLSFPTLISNWAEAYAPTASFIVTGHTHHAGIWKRKNRTIINTGCYGFPSHPRAVYIEKDVLSVYKIDVRGEQYTLGKRYASWDLR